MGFCLHLEGESIWMGLGWVDMRGPPIFPWDATGQTYPANVTHKTLPFLKKIHLSSRKANQFFRKFVSLQHGG